MMRATLAQKISVIVVSVVALAAASSAVALFASWHIGALMQGIIDENLPSVRAAEELKVALLGERGFLGLYLLDEGNPRWLWSSI